MNSSLNNILNFFDTEYPLNKDGLNELLQLFTVKIYPKNTILIEAGSAERYLQFLNYGAIREYYVTPQKETNINFYTTPQFISDLVSFNNDIPTRKNLETLTEVEVLRVEKSDFRTLLSKYDCGRSFIDMSFSKLLERKELFEYNRITKSAEDLYRELIIYKPQWLEKVPQYHIASYLNVTPETLSRIRKRIS